MQARRPLLRRSVVFLLTVSANAVRSMQLSLQHPAMSANVRGTARLCAPEVESDEDQMSEQQLEPSSPKSALAALASTASEASVVPTVGAACVATPTADERRRNLILAVAAPSAATMLYALQRANPINPVALLSRMEAQSPALSDALATGRPTLVEFYGTPNPHPCA